MTQTESPVKCPQGMCKQASTDGSQHRWCCRSTQPSPKQKLAADHNSQQGAEPRQQKSFSQQGTKLPTHTVTHGARGCSTPPARSQDTLIRSRLACPQTILHKPQGSHSSTPDHLWSLHHPATQSEASEPKPTTASGCQPCTCTSSWLLLGKGCVTL